MPDYDLKIDDKHYNLNWKGSKPPTEEEVRHIVQGYQKSARKPSAPSTPKPSGPNINTRAGYGSPQTAPKPDPNRYKRPPLSLAEKRQMVRSGMAKAAQEEGVELRSYKKPTLPQKRQMVQAGREKTASELGTTLPEIKQIGSGPAAKKGEKRLADAESAQQTAAIKERDRLIEERGLAASQRDSIASTQQTAGRGAAAVKRIDPALAQAQGQIKPGPSITQQIAQPLIGKKGAEQVPSVLAEGKGVEGAARRFASGLVDSAPLLAGAAALGPALGIEGLLGRVFQAQMTQGLAETMADTDTLGKDPAGWLTSVALQGGMLGLASHGDIAKARQSVGPVVQALRNLPKKDAAALAEQVHGEIQAKQAGNAALRPRTHEEEVRLQNYQKRGIKGAFTEDEMKDFTHLSRETSEPKHAPPVKPKQAAKIADATKKAEEERHGQPIRSVEARTGEAGGGGDAPKPSKPSAHGGVAGEGKARQPKSVGTQGVGSGESIQPAAGATKPVEPPKAATPTETPRTAEKPVESVTGLNTMHPGAGIADAMHDMLWKKAQEGDVTENGKPSALLQAAKKARDAGGVQTPEQMKALAADYGDNIAGKGLTGADFQKAMSELVARHSPEFAEPKGETDAQAKAIQPNGVHGDGGTGLPEKPVLDTAPAAPKAEPGKERASKPAAVGDAGKGKVAPPVKATTAAPERPATAPESKPAPPKPPVRKPPVTTTAAPEPMDAKARIEREAKRNYHLVAETPGGAQLFRHGIQEDEGTVYDANGRYTNTSWKGAKKIFAAQEGAAGIKVSEEMPKVPDQEGPEGLTAPKPKAPPRPLPEWRQKLKKDAEAAKKDLSKPEGLQAGINPGQFKKWAVIVADHILDGVDWTRDLLNRFGDSVRQHFPELLRQAKEYIRNEAKEGGSHLRRISASAHDKLVEHSAYRSSANEFVRQSVPKVLSHLNDVQKRRLGAYMVADRAQTELDSQVARHAADTNKLKIADKARAKAKRDFDKLRNTVYADPLKKAQDVRKAAAVIRKLDAERADLKKSIADAHDRVQRNIMARNVHSPLEGFFDPHTGVPILESDLQKFFSDPAVKKSVAAHRALVEPELEANYAVSGKAATGDRGKYGGAYLPAIALGEDGLPIVGGGGAGGLRGPIAEAPNTPGASEFHGTADKYVQDYEQAVRGRAVSGKRVATYLDALREFDKTGVTQRMKVARQRKDAQGNLLYTAGGVPAMEMVDNPNVRRRIVTVRGEQRPIYEAFVKGDWRRTSSPFDIQKPAWAAGGQRVGAKYPDLPTDVVMLSGPFNEFKPLLDRTATTELGDVASQIGHGGVMATVAGLGDAAAHGRALTSRLARVLPSIGKPGSIEGRIAKNWLPEINSLVMNRKTFGKTFHAGKMYDTADREAAAIWAARAGALPSEFGLDFMKSEPGASAGSRIATAAGNTARVSARILYGDNGLLINAHTTIYKFFKDQGLLDPKSPGYAENARAMKEAMRNMNTYTNFLRPGIQKWIHSKFGPLFSTFYQTGVRNRTIGFHGGYTNFATRAIGSVLTMALVTKMSDPQHRWPHQIPGYHPGTVYTGKDDSGRNTWIPMQDLIDRTQGYSDVPLRSLITSISTNDTVPQGLKHLTTDVTNLGIGPLVSGPAVGFGLDAFSRKIPFLSGDEKMLLNSPTANSPTLSADRMFALAEHLIPLLQLTGGEELQFKGSAPEGSRYEWANRILRLTGSPPIKVLNEQGALNRARKERLLMDNPNAFITVPKGGKSAGTGEVKLKKPSLGGIR